MRPSFQRPEPVPRHDAIRVDRNTPPDDAATRLREGDRLLVMDHYSTGAEILARLAEQRSEEDSRKGSRGPAELGLLAPIVAHKLALGGARPIGFLEDLYPELPDFFLPFVEVQELRGAWKRYEEGVHFAVLGHRLHPFYGTYVPTRVSHLELFGTWLSQYKGPRKQAIDVGTGAGVLAFMLSRAGFQGVVATDRNPNAIESVRRELGRLPTPPRISLQQGDLLGESGAEADLIVFNPPWTRGEAEGPIDRALYFEDGLFARFFDQVVARLRPSARVVMLFSNVITLVQPEVPHPIEAELARGRLRLVQRMRRKVPGTARRTRERVELWELARA